MEFRETEQKAVGNAVRNVVSTEYPTIMQSSIYLCWRDWATDDELLEEALS